MVKHFYKYHINAQMSERLENMQNLNGNITESHDA